MDVFNSKHSKNIVENNVQVEAVEFLLVGENKLSLENTIDEMGSHQKQENAKRKRRSLEEGQEDVPKSPKKFRKGGN